MKVVLQLALAACLAMVVGPTDTAAVAPVARYTANALNPGGDAGPPATLVQIDVDRWSTEDEHNQLVDPLSKNHQSEASTMLQHLPRVGSIRALDLSGEPIYYASHSVGPDRAEHVLLIASRPLQAFEASMKTNMSAFPFSVIELTLDASGNGSGTLELAATLRGAREHAISVVPDRLLLPVRLTKVTRAK